MKIALLVMFELRYIKENISDIYKYLIDYYQADVFICVQNQFEDDEQRINLFNRNVIHKELYMKPDPSSYLSNYNNIIDQAKQYQGHKNFYIPQVLQIFINMDKMAKIIHKYKDQYDYFITFRVDSKFLFTFPPKDLFNNIPAGTYEFKANYCQRWGGIGNRFLISKEYIMSYLESPVNILNNPQLLKNFINDSNYRKTQEYFLSYSLHVYNVPNFPIYTLNYYYTCESLKSYSTWARPVIHPKYKVICKYGAQCTEAYKNLDLFKKKYTWTFLNNGFQLDNLIASKHYFIIKNNFRRNNNYLRCLQNTYLIKKLNHDQSNNNKIPVKKGTLLRTLEIIDTGSNYYHIQLIS